MVSPLKAVKSSKLGKGDDLYAGTGGSDAVDGRGGNDILDGGEGNDRLIGGKGNDILRGQGGNDTLIGGAGNDLLQGYEGSDTLTGGRGADTFWWYWNNNTGDSDVITDFNRAEGDKIHLPSSRVDIAIRANIGWLLVDGQFSQAARLQSEEGQIVQVANGDGTFTLRIYGSGTALDPSPWYEIVVNTKLVPSDFSAGYEVRYPNVPTEGDDQFIGSNGTDRIDLLGGNDSFDGLSGYDEVHGGAGNDSIRAGDPLARMIGGSTLFGDAGDDLLVGGNSHDRLYGGSDNDRLIGNAGGDVLSGGSGDDVLIGGLSGDELDGGAGVDRFVYLSIADSPTIASYQPTAYYLDYGYQHPDTIFDFDPTAGDVIDLRGLDIDPQTAGVQTAAWTFAGSNYDPALGGTQFTLSEQLIYNYKSNGAFDPRPGTVLSLYLDDGDDVPDFQVQIGGQHDGTGWILI